MQKINQEKKEAWRDENATMEENEEGSERVYGKKCGNIGNIIK